MYSIGLFEHAVKVQVYPFIYDEILVPRTKKLIVLPKNIRIFWTNDMLTSFDLEQSI